MTSQSFPNLFRKNKYGEIFVIGEPDVPVNRNVNETPERVPIETQEITVNLDTIRIEGHESEIYESLPDDLKQREELSVENLTNVQEILFFLGKPIRVRSIQDKVVEEVPIICNEIHIQHILSKTGERNGDGRCSGDETGALNRISVELRKSVPYLIAFRFGRAIYGLADVLKENGCLKKNLLVIGKPSVGKTTLLRDISRVLGDDNHEQVYIIDTCGEICGRNMESHSSIGNAYRLFVEKREEQASLMSRAIQNLSATVLIIDEITTRKEAENARNISKAGIQLISTTHGETIADVFLNREVSDLFGKRQNVILSADEKVKESARQKSKTELIEPPCFDGVLEIHSKNEWLFYDDLPNMICQYINSPTTPLVPKLKIKMDSR